jgi:hypothetical protein
MGDPVNRTKHRAISDDPGGMILQNMAEISRRKAARSRGAAHAAAEHRASRRLRAGSATEKIIELLISDARPFSRDEILRRIPDINRQCLISSARNRPELIGSRIGDRTSNGRKTYLWARIHERAASAAMKDIETKEQSK